MLNLWLIIVYCTLSFGSEWGGSSDASRTTSEDYLFATGVDWEEMKLFVGIYGNLAEPSSTLSDEYLEKIDVVYSGILNIGNYSDAAVAALNDWVQEASRARYMDIEEPLPSPLPPTLPLPGYSCGPDLETLQAQVSDFQIELARISASLETLISILDVELVPRTSIGVETASEYIDVASQDMVTPSEDIDVASQDMVTPSEDIDVDSQDTVTPSEDIDVDSQDMETGSQTEPENYELVTTSASWSVAEADCVSRGGHLASIHTAAENVMLSSLAGDAWTWFGLNDIDVEGSFGFVDGTELGDYENWSADQPDNGGGIENCAHLWTIGGVPGMWNDYQCENTVSQYICQTGP